MVLQPIAFAIRMRCAQYSAGMRAGCISHADHLERRAVEQEVGLAERKGMRRRLSGYAGAERHGGEHKCGCNPFHRVTPGAAPCGWLVPIL